MNIILATNMPGVLLVKAPRHEDARGSLMEVYKTREIRGVFVQDNVLHSKEGVLRGLHCTKGEGSGKLIIPLAGRIFDVAVNLRKDSEFFGRWVGFELGVGDQMFISPGFAHGLLSLTESIVMYKTTQIYGMYPEGSLRWNDPEVGIAWPKVAKRIMTEKDACADSLDAWR